VIEKFEIRMAKFETNPNIETRSDDETVRNARKSLINTPLQRGAGMK